ncbi:MAG TPA: nitronate monooxygenase family protein [Pseudolabrys sp.]|nr:nitronate monooxygenase family protein [Pseudolabrys sp.]
MWPDRRLLELLHIELPIVQAPMAGAMDFQLVAAVSEAGGLGSLPCATLSVDKMRDEIGKIRARTAKPFNVNFFCHTPPVPNNARESAWRERLAPYYRELGVDPVAPVPTTNRAPFDAAFRDAILDLQPAVVSFHFGLPEPALLDPLKRAGIIILGSATTVAEARWLETNGADAIIAQGFEAGGHRGMFLTEDIATQVGSLALVPQTVDAVRVPVIAAGGIADARAIAAAFALGASAVQIGSAFLHCPEAKTAALHRAALKTLPDDGTVITNVISGRPARGIRIRVVREVGPISELAPQFPLASGALAPLRAKAEAAGSPDFSTQWAGQAAALGRDIPAGEATKRLATEALERLRGLAIR